MLLNCGSAFLSKYYSFVATKPLAPIKARFADEAPFRLAGQIIGPPWQSLLACVRVQPSI